MDHLLTIHARWNMRIKAEFIAYFTSTVANSICYFLPPGHSQNYSPNKDLLPTYTYSEVFHVLHNPPVSNLGFHHLQQPFCIHIKESFSADTSIGKRIPRFQNHTLLHCHQDYSLFWPQPLASHNLVSIPLLKSACQLFKISRSRPAATTSMQKGDKSDQDPLHCTPR